MGEKILVIGESGSGKSRATKTLDPKTTFYINCIGKALPYKGWKGDYIDVEVDGKGNMFKTVDSGRIVSAMKRVSNEKPEVKTIIVDDAQYIMSFEYMAKAMDKGYDKFTLMAQHMFNVLTAPDDLRDDLVVVFMGHCDTIDGMTRMKTIGKMIDNAITVEGLFTVVLLAYSYKENEGRMNHVFVTNSNGTNTAKSPEGMFNLTMDNDLAEVLNSITNTQTKGGNMEDNLIDLLQGYEPTIQEDFEPVDFSIPVSVGAKAVCTEAGRTTGISKGSGKNMNIFKIRLQISEVVSAKSEQEKRAAKNRMIDVAYFVEPNNYQEPKEVVASILNDLTTAGFPLKLPKEKMEDEDLYCYIATHFIGLKDKTFDVRCYPGKKKEDGTRPQKTRIVKRDVTSPRKDSLSKVPF